MKNLLLWGCILFLSLFIGSSVFAGNNFWIALEEWADTNTLWQWINLIWEWWSLESRFSGVSLWWWEWIRDFLAWIWLEVLVPVFVFAGVIFALIGFYKLMTATSDEEIWKASMFLLRWVVWIMIMLSAAYIVDQLVWVDSWWEWWIIAMITWWNESWWAIAAHI